MKNSLISTLIIGLFVVSIGSCKKKEMATAASSCTSTIYGYSSSSWSDTNSVSGIVNASTATISTGVPIFATLFTSQAAYNAGDNCCYAFGSYRRLCKISSAGTVTPFTYSGTDSIFSALTYNIVTNKLYCLTLSHLAEITISGTTFTLTNLAPSVNTLDWYFRGSLTVDNNTGDMYLKTGSYGSYYVEKYHIGGSATTVVATNTSAWDLIGLRYNSNDNMLYGISESATGSVYSLVKISPASGSITTLCALSNPLNVDFYSACIDPCSNRYILSTNGGFVGGVFVPMLDQYSTTGALVQHNVTSTLFLGLDVHQISL